MRKSKRRILEMGGGIESPTKSLEGGREAGRESKDD